MSVLVCFLCKYLVCVCLVFWSVHGTLSSIFQSTHDTAGVVISCVSCSLVVSSVLVSSSLSGRSETLAFSRSFFCRPSSIAPDTEGVVITPVWSACFLVYVTARCIRAAPAHFSNQRFRSRPVVCAVDTAFDETFLMELQGPESMSPVEISTSCVYSFLVSVLSVVCLCLVCCLFLLVLLLKCHGMTIPVRLKNRDWLKKRDFHPKW